MRRNPLAPTRNLRDQQANERLNAMEAQQRQESLRLVPPENTLRLAQPYGITGYPKVKLKRVRLTAQVMDPTAGLAWLERAKTLMRVPTPALDAAVRELHRWLLGKQNREMGRMMGTARPKPMIRATRRA